VIAGASAAAARRSALLLLAVCLALVVALAPRPASAHSTILSSNPRAGEKLRTGPGVVVLTFSQPLDIQLSRASVMAPDGQRFDQSSVSSDEIRVPVASNAPGVYGVSWTSVSAVDGHILSGGFRFGVNVSPTGDAVDAPLPSSGDLSLAALRALEYAGLLLAVGFLLLLQLAALAPRLEWVRTGLPVVLAATALAGLAVVLAEALAAAGAPSPGTMAVYLGSGPAGWTRLGRVAAEVAALAVALRWPRLTALPLGAALVALAAAGHAAAVRPVPLGDAVTVLHLASAGLWAGGVLALAAQRPPGGWRAREGRRLLARFSPVALAAFAVTAATGVLQGAEELNGLGDLVTTAYGQVLGLKALAVLAMVPLSVLAWRRLFPAPRLEAALALVVVAASALLAAFPLPPARLHEAEAAQAGPSAALALPSDGDLTMASSAGDVLVGLTVRPGRPGPNTAWLYVLPIGGEPAASGLTVTVTAAGHPQVVRRCGPACRAADLDLHGGEPLAVGVGGAVTAAFRAGLPGGRPRPARRRAPGRRRRRRRHGRLPGAGAAGAGRPKRGRPRAAAHARAAYLPTRRDPRPGEGAALGDVRVPVAGPPRIPSRRRRRDGDRGPGAVLTRRAARALARRVDARRPGPLVRLGRGPRRGAARPHPGRGRRPPGGVLLRGAGRAPGLVRAVGGRPGPGRAGGDARPGPLHDAPLLRLRHATDDRPTRLSARYPLAMPLTAVFFDVGETLVDETELMGGWADWLGVPRLTFFAALGAVLDRSFDGSRPLRGGAGIRDVMRLVRPGLDIADALRRRGEAGRVFSVEDLYPDALPCLLAVRDRGYRVGIAANQPALADAVVRASGLPFDWLLISDVEGVSKPDPAFFERILAMSGLPASSIAYVGDRVDNDVVPAVRAGMAAVHVRRGPWGVIQADWPDAALASLRVGSLAELPGRLHEIDGTVRSAR
jgi:FMN phosphatase YigB (HAD superfamily)/putative copper export protein/methionine-rich copper-binding protein CopC